MALTFALDYPDDVSGVVVESGYYYPARRPDAAIASINAKPVIGWVTRNTVSPVMGAVLGKALVGGMFSPNPIPPTFSQFPAKLTLRPSQLRASAEEAATMRRWALQTSPYYREIRVPVGAGDRVADYRRHSVRLHQEIPNSRLRVWPNTGHMVHHVHPADVVEAIGET